MNTLIRNNFLNLKSFLLGVAIFTLMIDSGGRLGLRNLGFVLFLLFALSYLSKNNVNKKTFIIICMIFLISFIGIIINNIEISKSFQWIVFLIIIYVFYKSFLIFNETEFTNGFLFAGFLFSIIILSVHFLLITDKELF